MYIYISPCGLRLEIRHLDRRDVRRVRHDEVDGAYYYYCINLSLVLVLLSLLLCLWGVRHDEVDGAYYYYY